MIKILTVPHTLFAARNLVNTLNKLGHQAAIFDKPVPGDESMYIIYQANHVAAMPKNYIIQQTEIALSHWFKPESGYLRKIKRAAAVWDYCQENIAHYGAINKRICIVNPGVFPQPPVEKDIRFLFYGHIGDSERRARILEKMQKDLPLKIVTNTLGQEMWDILARTQTVFNIHYHENSPLEAYRIAEAQSFGCKVMTERRQWINYEESIFTFGINEFVQVYAPECTVESVVHGLRLAGIETVNEIEV